MRATFLRRRWPGSLRTRPFRFNTSACENGNSTIARLPLHRGTSHGETVWYVIMDSSSQTDAERLHINFAPKLANVTKTTATSTVPDSDH